MSSGSQVNSSTIPPIHTAVAAAAINGDALTETATINAISSILKALSLSTVLSGTPLESWFEIFRETAAIPSPANLLLTDSPTLMMLGSKALDNASN